MSDCYDDCEASISLVIDEYLILQRLKPKHELLKLAKGVDSTGFDTTRSFSRRYAERAKRHKTRTGKITDMNMGYYADLNDAIILELRTLVGQERGTTEEGLWKKMEERGLVGVVRTHLTHNQVPLTTFVQ